MKVAGTDYYDVTQRVVAAQIIPGLGPTTVLAYNGTASGDPEQRRAHGCDSQ